MLGSARLTRRGLGLLGSVPVLAGAGAGLGYPELVVLAASALLALAAALGYAARPAPVRVTRRVLPARLERGEPCRVELTLHATGRHAGLVGHDRCGGSTVEVPVPAQRRGRSVVSTHPVPTDRRGVVVVGPLRLLRRDPLGLATAGGDHGGRLPVFVHPRAYPLRALPAGVTRSLDGRRDRVPHGSLTVDRLRGYVPGDDLRHVHWRTSARTGSLMVREYVDTSLPRMVLLLDDRAGTDAGRFETLCEAAASLVVAAAREEVTLRLVLVGTPTLPHPGGRAALDALAGAAPSAPAGALADAGRLLSRHAPGDTLVALTASDRVEDAAAVRALRPSYPDVVLVRAHPDARSTMDGIRVLAVADGPGFAAAWNGLVG
jgi:uncharacterized protein (DUF58 family)